MCMGYMWQKFWNWSWDELVTFDLPAVFDLVYKETGQKIDYVGHSLVSTKQHYYKYFPKTLKSVTKQIDYDPSWFYYYLF